MAQQVYSVRLWNLPSTTLAGTIVGPGPAAGFVWVVRDVRAVSTGALNGALLFPLGLSIGGTMPIFSTPTYSSILGLVYEWHGRAIVNAGELLEAASQHIGWAMTVDGYQLSTP